MTPTQTNARSSSTLNDGFFDSSFAWQINQKIDSGKQREHKWISVVDPISQGLFLQACDDCGVVKSENSVVRRCRAEYGAALISSACIEKLK